MKEEILKDILGNLSLVNYIVGFFFVLLALSLKWIWKTVQGVKHSSKTPNKFDKKFWWKDNAKPKILTLLANLISVFLIFRFTNEIIGVDFSYGIALFIGLGLDYYINKLKNAKYI